MMKLFATICLALIIFSNLSLAATTQLSASKDNTIYEATLNSNGAGDYFFAGKTGEELSYRIRRSLLMFNLTSIPADAKILSVTLRLHMSRTKTTTGRTISLHALEQDWGEEDSHASGEEGGGGAASVGDATWNFAFMRSVEWQNAGGDFSGTTSASQTVGATGYYTWGSTDGMVSDIQSWVSDPSKNFGWLIKGDEANTSTAKRFDSRTNAVNEYRPLLEIEYEAPDVHISEVFQYPEKEGFPGEFVEIFNAGKIEQKLDGWMLYQPNLQLLTVLNEKSLLNGDLILQPGEYAVIGRGSADEFKNLWGFLPDTYFSEGNSSDAGAPQLSDGAYFELWTYNESIKDWFGHIKTFQFQSSRNHYTRINYPNRGTDAEHWLADTQWGNPGTDNFAPVAGNDNAEVNEDGSIKINILDNDSDLDGTLDGSSVKITANPTKGKITSINAKTGEVSYEPDADYFGSDRFNYTVNDDKNKTSNEASVRITIYAINDAPEINELPDQLVLNTDSTIIIMLWNYVTDVETPDNKLKYSFTSSEDSLNYEYNDVTGALTLTAIYGLNSDVVFEITVEDDSAASATQIITISVETISGLAENFSAGAPAKFGLSQNYPNPFNPSTTIRYQLAEATEVHLEVYNSLGQSVAVLVSGRLPAGEYDVMFDTMAYNLASGIYIYQLTAGKFRQTRKMVLMR